MAECRAPVTIHRPLPSEHASRWQISTPQFSLPPSELLSLTVPITKMDYVYFTLYNSRVSQFLVIYAKQPILELTQERFRELFFSRLECGAHDRLDIYPNVGSFTSPGIDTR